jgi:hypothetical protein
MKIKTIFLMLVMFFLTLNFANANNMSFCQYNAFKNATITTCSNWYSSYYCDKLFDEDTTFTGSHEWITQSGELYNIPPYTPILIAEVDNPFYFNQTEVWVRSYIGYSYSQANAFTIDLYSPVTNSWYNIITETNFNNTYNSTNNVKFGGSAGGQGVVFYNISGMIISYSKIRVTITDVLNNDPDNLIFPELAICVKGYNSSSLAYSNFSGLDYADIGDPCDDDNDCDCTNCEYGFCALMGGSENCLINGTERDDCCLSGVCTFDKCTKASMWAGMVASKNQQFGDDANTNNFISLFFIFAISGFLMYYGNVIAGIFALYLLSIFFVIIGWLSSFILIGIILTGLIAIFFKSVIGGSSE